MSPTPRLRLLVPAAVIALGVTACVAAVLLLRPAPHPTAGPDGEPLVATFSIVGYDPETGDLGVAVQSKFPNVRAVVPWVEAGVGAVATQSFARLAYGEEGLALMRNGATAEEALRILVREDPSPELRQVGIVDARSNAATWTGAEAFDWAGGRVGQRDGGPSTAAPGVIVAGTGYTAQGNILVSEETVEAMARTFEATEGSLAERLLAALLAGGAAGGDRRGEQSAALVVHRKNAGYDASDVIVDISVYDHPTPLAELERLYRLNDLYFTDSRPENMTPITPELARELQQIWIERGFYDGPADGVVDAAFQQLLVDFMGWENYDLRIDEVQRVDLAAGETLMIDREVLEDIRAVYREGRWRPRQP